MSYDSDAFWAKARTKQEAEANKARGNNPYHSDQMERLESAETDLQWVIQDFLPAGHLAVLTKTPATISQITVASGVEVLSKLARADQIRKEKEPRKPVVYALQENVASIGT